MPKKSGNPAKHSWDPIQVGKAAWRGETIGMAAKFYSSDGREHFYNYRSYQRAIAAIAFHNRLYNGFGLIFEDESMHLSFKRNDRAAVRDWRHFQAIKNEVAGPEREAIEIFPPESQLVDGANEYHLWVLPPDMQTPVGFDQGRELGDATNTHDNARYRQGGAAGYAQRGWEEGIPTGLGQPDNDTKEDEQ
jgi:hypothetical protein